MNVEQSFSIYGPSFLKCALSDLIGTWTGVKIGNNYTMTRIVQCQWNIISG